jgi:hypothetical protein
MARKYENRKGVTTVRLFHKVWKFGRPINKKGKERHLVIYGPDDKEYHVYGKDVEDLLLVYYDWYDEPELNKKASKTKVKNYILTRILDKGNWCFDMDFGPKIGNRVKVLYEGSTVKWIDFKRNWDDSKMKIEKMRPMRSNPKWTSTNDESQYIWEPHIEYKKVIAWRK